MLATIPTQHPKGVWALCTSTQHGVWARTSGGSSGGGGGGDVRGSDGGSSGGVRSRVSGGRDNGGGGGSGARMGMMW